MSYIDSFVRKYVKLQEHSREQRQFVMSVLYSTEATSINIRIDPGDPDFDSLTNRQLLDLLIGIKYIRETSRKDRLRF